MDGRRTLPGVSKEKGSQCGWSGASKERSGQQGQRTWVGQVGPRGHHDDGSFYARKMTELGRSEQRLVVFYLYRPA